MIEHIDEGTDIQVIIDWLLLGLRLHFSDLVLRDLGIHRGSGDAEAGFMVKVGGNDDDLDLILQLFIKGDTPNEVDIRVAASWIIWEALVMSSRSTSGGTRKLTITPRAPLMEVSSSGEAMAMRAASSALLGPLAAPRPIWA